MPNCIYCGHSDGVTQDHIIPKSLLLNLKNKVSNVQYNLAPCCKVCNHVKQNKFILPTGEALRKAYVNTPDFYIQYLADWIEKNYNVLLDYFKHTENAKEYSLQYEDLYTVHSLYCNNYYKRLNRDTTEPSNKFNLAYIAKDITCESVVLDLCNTIKRLEEEEHINKDLCDKLKAENIALKTNIEQYQNSKQDKESLCEILNKCKNLEAENKALKLSIKDLQKININTYTLNKNVINFLKQLVSTILCNNVNIFYKDTDTTIKLAKIKAMICKKTPALTSQPVIYLELTDNKIINFNDLIKINAEQVIAYKKLLYILNKLKTDELYYIVKNDAIKQLSTTEIRFESDMQSAELKVYMAAADKNNHINSYEYTENCFDILDEALSKLINKEDELMSQ